MAVSKIFCLILLTIFHIISAFLEEKMFGVSLDIVETKSKNMCEGNNLLQCTAECDALMVCDDGNFDPILIQTCDVGTPYCESSNKSAACQATAGTKCKPSISFECTGSGYFPDLRNCRKYYYCGNFGNTPQPYECPVGYVYSSKHEICTRSLTCNPVTCPITEIVLSAYTANPQFYYICRPNQSPKVYKCPVENQQFRKGMGCTFICPDEGVYENDKNSFYFCYRESFTLKYVIYECPSGTTFNKDKKRCEIDTNLLVSSQNRTL